jgi:hypothetical protein
LWTGYVSAGRTACRRHPETCLELRYEDLVQDPKPVVRRLCAHVGLDFTFAGSSALAKASEGPSALQGQEAEPGKADPDIGRAPHVE